MAAYVIVQVEVTDWERFKEYLQETPQTIVHFGGKYLVRGGEKVTLEGEKHTKRVVVIEFPSMDSVKAWYASEDYQRIKSLREGAAVGSLVAVQGC